MSDLNGEDGFYGIHAQFAILIEDRLYKQATKIMNSVNSGFLWSVQLPSSCKRLQGIYVEVGSKPSLWNLDMEVEYVLG